jgi:hypothetical protein
MPEIWENPFANAILKVERANKHIADIEQRLRASSDRYGPMMHVNSQTGEQSLDYYLTDRALRRDLALIVGDAIHNLRCALDIAWNRTVAVWGTKAPSKHRKFPIDPRGTREKLKSTLTKSAEIPASSPVVPFMLDQVKCYQGGDGDLLALSDLDIDDKHRLIIPMLTVTGIEGVEIENPDGSILRLDIMLIPPNAYRKVVPLEAKLKNHGEVRFEVTFREGTPLEGAEVIPTLKRFSRKTSRIVRALQRMGRGVL